MRINQALDDAKSQAEIRIRELQASGFSAEAIKKSLNLRESPFLDDLIDYVFRSTLHTSPSSMAAVLGIKDDADLQRKLMGLAVQEARKCVPEDRRTHPKVGAVVVKDRRTIRLKLSSFFTRKQGATTTRRTARAGVDEAETPENLGLLAMPPSKGSIGGSHRG